MISKKKKSVHQISLNSQPPLLQQSGLFSPKAQKQHLLQQLKKGTLFNFYPKKNSQSPNQQSLCVYRDDNDWLSHIRLCGEEEEEIQNPHINSHSTNHLSKTAPNSKHFPAIQNKKKQELKPKIKLSNRCGKLVCYEKKLQKTAAWNKENPNNIDQSMTFWGTRTCKNYKQLDSNDFKRIPGLNFNDRSFEQSIEVFGPNTSICTNNAFENLCLMDTTGKSKLREKSTKKLFGSLRKRKEVQGHFIPGFLMQAIILQDMKKSSQK